MLVMYPYVLVVFLCFLQISTAMAVLPASNYNCGFGMARVEESILIKNPAENNQICENVCSGATDEVCYYPQGTDVCSGQVSYPLRKCNIWLQCWCILVQS